jgi:hypothetical protein
MMKRIFSLEDLAVVPRRCLDAECTVRIKYRSTYLGYSHTP